MNQTLLHVALITMAFASMDGTLEGICTNTRQKRSAADLPHALLWLGRSAVCAVIALFAYRSNESAWCLPLFWLMAFAIWPTYHRVAYNLLRLKSHPWWWMGAPDKPDSGSLYDDLMHLSAIAITGDNAGARPFIIATLFETSIAALCAIALHLIT